MLHVIVHVKHDTYFRAFSFLCNSLPTVLAIEQKWHFVHGRHKVHIFPLLNQTALLIFRIAVLWSYFEGTPTLKATDNSF